MNILKHRKLCVVITMLLCLGMILACAVGCTPVAEPELTATPETETPSPEPTYSPLPEGMMAFDRQVYPVDAESITMNLTEENIEMLELAVNLQEITIYIDSDKTTSMPYMALPDTLQAINLNVSGKEKFDFGNCEFLNGLTQLNRLTIDGEAVGAVALSKLPITAASFTLESCDALDLGNCTSLTDLELGGNYGSIALPKITQLILHDAGAISKLPLSEMDAVSRIAINTPCDLSFLAQLPNGLKTLSLSWENADDAAMKQIATIGSAKVGSLYLSGIFGWSGDSSIVSNLPNVKTIQVYDSVVKDIQSIIDEGTVETLMIWLKNPENKDLSAYSDYLNTVAITSENFDVIDGIPCLIPAEQLEAFVNNGGTIYVLSLNR